MSAPIDLSEWRRDRVGYGTCAHCGGAWFRVEALTFGKDGRASGIAGIPCCIRCGHLNLHDLAPMPEGVPMPCGSCREPLTLPQDAAHECPCASGIEATDD